MGTKRLVNIAALLCAVGLLAILVLPESIGAGMRTAGILVLMALAFLYIFRSRSDDASARDLAAELVDPGRTWARPSQLEVGHDADSRWTARYGFRSERPKRALDRLLRRVLRARPAPDRGRVPRGRRR